MMKASTIHPLILTVVLGGLLVACAETNTRATAVNSGDRLVCKLNGEVSYQLDAPVIQYRSDGQAFTAWHRNEGKFTVYIPNRGEECVLAY